MIDPIGNGLEKAGPEVAARFSRLVRDLVWELHPHMQRRVAITLDSDLDRDLGLDSLGRAELVLRNDRAFKVHLPDRLLPTVWMAVMLTRGSAAASA